MSYSDKLAASMYQFKEIQKEMRKYEKHCPPKQYGMMIQKRRKRGK